jgi:hypothetical protein
MPEGTILKKWPKANPQKLPETDAMFAQVERLNEEADEAPDT